MPNFSRGALRPETNCGREYVLSTSKAIPPKMALVASCAMTTPRSPAPRTTRAITMAMAWTRKYPK